MSIKKIYICKYYGLFILVYLLWIFIKLTYWKIIFKLKYNYTKLKVKIDVTFRHSLFYHLFLFLYNIYFKNNEIK